jgi:AMMECR1 domain-containing protein
LFIVHLKNKAGLRDDFWAEDLQLYRYTVSSWSETDLRQSKLHV